METSPGNPDSPEELSVTIDGKRITWHAAAIDAFKLDLLEYAEGLEYIEEHTLTNEPLRVDIVIIKKKKDVEPVPKLIDCALKAHGFGPGFWKKRPKVRFFHINPR
ncbi:MAG: hypothetical protein LBQ35_05935 [Spirochaetaceae bacterium]|jgi:hypothetical protein|nr:hypothetical protein [Spirochaetaceae bacterium]